MYVDLRDVLSEQNVPEDIEVRVRPEDSTDEFGIQVDFNKEVVHVKGVITEKLENGYDVKTGTFLERVVYKIYLDRLKYGHIDFSGAEVKFRGKEFMGVSYPLVRPYASHFIITATERKVNLSDKL